MWNLMLKNTIVREKHRSIIPSHITNTRLMSNNQNEMCLPGTQAELTEMFKQK